MRVAVFVSLIAAAAWAYPERRAADKQLEVTQANYVTQQVQSLSSHSSGPQQREAAPRDCKGKSATIIAQKAAAEAQAAQAAQNAAGAQAAHMVKTQLAEKALQAAKAAEAALAGKQAVVEQLQQEVHEAEAVVAENTAAVQQQQATTNAACQAAQQATAQHKLMVQATQLAALLEKSAHCVLDKTKFGLQEKCHTLAEARSRLAHLQHKLQCAIAECAATKHAAHSACEAARAACGNARKKKQAEHSETTQELEIPSEQEGRQR
ncbi:hypothetical protein EVAR_47749_1 [Eumeta japonica]|uniref:Uncharacterized protein n=1 Tax=Eumeta variegata TaxID=151549 RepID=A0A4C1VWZ3_EUMVA|nr:hypothetical protein EVAR_47749_1 [Eumeta japonica]